MTCGALAIGGLTIAVCRRTADFPFVVGSAQATFWQEAAGTAPTTTVSVGWLDADSPVVHREKPLFASGGMWTLYQAADGGYVYDISSPVFGAAPYRVAWFDADYRSGWVGYTPSPAVRRAIGAPLEYPLDELVVTNLLARGRGVELHACAVVDTDGRGWLLVGQSGDGKTTMARLWSAAGATVLSDDRVIVRQEGRRWLMYGTPWHGEAAFARPGPAEITRMFILRHGARNRRVTLTPGQAAAWLFARSFPPFYDAVALDFTTDFLGQLVAEVGCEMLAFAPTRAVVDAIRGGEV
ncbi:MAG: hypothetical protein ACUVR8_10660 [Acidobacteriota bacterium]